MAHSQSCSGLRDASSKQPSLEFSKRRLGGFAKVRRGYDDQHNREPPEFIEQRHALSDAPRQPIETVHEDPVDLSPSHERQQSIQRGTIKSRPRVTVVIEELRQQRPAVNALGLQVQAARLALNLA